MTATASRTSEGTTRANPASGRSPRAQPARLMSLDWRGKTRQLAFLNLFEAATLYGVSTSSTTGD
ncbi:hypothetical protein [Specibacter cremeus]|uniref:hypothetical protein n=1 Tax=Specibacter cremeus TaxID=1629051 RepID=UPI000F7A1DDF|nr:hypothetical protein [Specibacter cremeus]